MKTRLLTIFSLLSLLSFYSSFAQDITGSWQGTLTVQGTKLRLVFHIDSAYKATMDSPDQGAKGIPVPIASFKNNELVLELPNALIMYRGTFIDEGLIKGTLEQAGQSFPLDLAKGLVHKEKRRFQEPSTPLSYSEEEVTFRNEEAGITLSGTLTLPSDSGIYPAVILITGSGPQNRDEELAGHKPFLVLADHLTRNGIAVLRFDDRGTGKSQGNFHEATTLDFASDVEAALNYILNKEGIDKNQIGLIGHSEGGIIAPIVASKLADISFIVLLAGTGISGAEVLLEQHRRMSELMKLSKEEYKKNAKVYEEIYDLIGGSQNLDTLKRELVRYLNDNWIDMSDYQKSGMSQEDYIKFQVSQLATPWMRFFISYDPVEALQNVSCPVLALNGEKDWQVEYHSNLKAIEIALVESGNRKVRIKSLPSLNHLFQECETGSPLEYAQIEQTISPIALEEITSWIQGVLYQQTD